MDSELSMQVFFFVVVVLWMGGGGEAGRSKAKSSQVPDMFPKEFPIALYLYPIRFDKCCPLVTFIGGPKGRNSILQNRTFYSAEPQ